MTTQVRFRFGGQNEILFCLEMANNHQGSVEHGMNIIAEFAAVARRTQARTMLKLQFRELQSFLTPGGSVGCQRQRPSGLERPYETVQRNGTDEGAIWPVDRLCAGV